MPNFFGVCLQETDRCLFQLSELPNGRLGKRPPFGLLRKLSEVDLGKPFFDTGSPAINATTYSSLWYEQSTRGSEVYVYERGEKIFGVLSFWKRGNGLLIDLIANASDYRRKGIGGAMMRWAETWARSTDCKFVELWAIENRVEFYERYKFELQPGREMTLDGSRFFLMRRKLLYNINLTDFWDMF